MRGILFSGIPNRKINYLYNALGQKVEKKITNNLTETTTNYQGMFHYENQVLKFIGTSEGYVNVTSGRRTENGPSYIFSYIYNYTDHLGNIRVSYTNNGINAAIIEENHYYPFGLKHKKYGSVDKDLVCVNEDCYEIGIDVVPPQARKTYQYKYQGQELQDELGLNWYSYKWRNYDPAIARFMSIDPLAEEYEDYTTYQFSSNQPVHAIELEGLESSDDKNKRKELDPNSVKYKAVEGLFNVIMAMGDLGAKVEGTQANTIEEKIEYSSSGMRFIIDNTFFIQGTKQMNKTSSSNTKSSNTKTTTTTNTKTGLIYKVPGEATTSGKPYIGRTKQESPAIRGRGAKDGRDRTKATVVDKYDTSKPKEGSYKEQKAINNSGGVKNLDNKRNEMSKKNFEEYENQRNSGR